LESSGKEIHYQIPDDTASILDSWGCSVVVCIQRIWF
jgi:hypothetical protein